MNLSSAYYLTTTRKNNSNSNSSSSSVRSFVAVLWMVWMSSVATLWTTTTTTTTLLFRPVRSWTTTSLLSTHRRSYRSSSTTSAYHRTTRSLLLAAAPALWTVGTTRSRVVAAAAATMTTTSTAFDNNPLLDIASTSTSSENEEPLPSFTRITPEDITPAVTTLLEQLKQDFASLETKLSSCSSTESSSTESTESNIIHYDDVIPILEQIQYPIGMVWGIVSHLQGVANTDALRQAYNENQPTVVQTMAQLSQSQPLYRALSKIAEATATGTSASSSTKDDEGEQQQQRRRAVELALLRMKLGGVGLETMEQTTRFNEIQQRLAALSTSFSNHVLDATKAYSITITNPNDIEGAPPTAKAMWATAHTQYIQQQQKKKQEKEAEAVVTESDTTTPSETDNSDVGPWRITLDGPSYMAVMQHVANRTVREQVYRAYITRASSMAVVDVAAPTVADDDTTGETKEEDVSTRDNEPLIYEILTLRQEMATMLGFTNYAELSLASKMAPSIQAVTDLSEMILETALPAAQQEWDEITQLARNTNNALDDDAGGVLKPWDVSYWSERLKEQKFSLTEEETRPYFALPAVLQGMFRLVERLFQIVVEPVTNGEVDVWNPDVQFFKVYQKLNDNNDDKRKHIASFYLDPYARPENKRGGAWMDVCVGKSNAVGRTIPVAYLTCNGSPPTASQPSLMTFREVETLFHEFGHGLQHMLTKVTVGDVAGINGIEWDAVELPSQFMENWCYDRPTVYGFAKHWETGEPMPEEMFEKLKLQKTYNAGMMSCRQLQFGQLDMELHAKYDAVKGASGEGESIFDVQRRIAQKYTPYNLPLPEDRFLCSFSHIFAGGYAAGYYSYKWAEVMSADAFAAFEDVGLDNEDQVQEVGRRFRDTVLSCGGGEDPMTVFRTFRGREPNPEALLRHNGLVATVK